MSELPNPVLPGDLVNDILLRLPVKSICRFKCVSKPWRSLLSCPQFVRAHLKLHADDPEDLILTSSSSSDHAPYILTLAAAPAAGVARKVHLQSELLQPVVAGSCDGLVLLQYARRCKILFNPLTLETAEVLDDRDEINRCSYGFGYDSSSDDYKIVSLSKAADGNRSLVDVYSVRMKCWKRIGDSFYALEDLLDDKSGPAPGVYLNGCIHWLGWDTRNGFVSLVCYDLAREEFEEELFPFRVHGRFEFEIRVFEGCLALVSELYLNTDVGNTLIDVWVMREYGVRDSWSKVATIECQYNDWAYNAVCVLNEDEIVVERDSEQLLAYNWRNEIWRDLVIDGVPHGFRRVMPFRGSLLSPN